MVQPSVSENSASPARPAADPVVTTAAGQLRGLWRDVRRHSGGTVREWRSAAFLGIPFAQAPVGELRFAAPVPPEPWDGVRDALADAPTPQRETLAEITLIPEPSIPGEATLNLNVFTPAPSADAALPVMVYIHGGGFTAGSPASPWYDGSAFNRDGVVTVSISYRLGFDGFGWIDGAPHNRGVLDWLLALEWVQNNIAAFGGDPRRVTIAGQSAGGGAVLTLLGMPRAQHLFQRVHCISGALADVAPERAKTLAGRLASLAGVENTRDGFASVDELKILELQEKAQHSESGPPKPADMLKKMVSDGLPFGPMVDGELIARPTLESLRAGVGADKDLVMGSADDEFSMAFDSAPKIMRLVPARFLLGGAGLKGARRAAYLAANKEVAKRGSVAVLGRYVTDAMFRKAILGLVEARHAGGSTAKLPARTWLYRFSWPSGVVGSAMHCLDVPFIFDCLDSVKVDALAGPNPPQALAEEVHASAVGFIVDGDPGWPAYESGSELTKVYDVPSTVVRDGYASARPLLNR
jgi:para-nitrobenzyl esterase